MSFTLKIVPDQDPSNPRTEIDNVTQMACAHRRYTLGDEGFGNEAMTVEQIKREHGPIVLIKPLYMYDHSGLTIKTSPFECRWDSGQIGWVWITKEKAAKEYVRSKAYPSRAKWAEALLEGEVNTYDQYLRGDVHGYQIVEDATGAVVDSCWGFYGEDYVKEEGQRALDYVLANPEQYATRKAA